MAFAPARVAPAVAQQLQIPVQVLLYVGLFIFAQYLVNRWQVPLPANLVGMVMLLLLIVCRVIPVSWVRAGARWLLAEMLLFFVRAGRGGELRPAVDGRWLADFSGDCLKHADGARRHRLGR